MKTLLITQRKLTLLLQIISLCCIYLFFATTVCFATPVVPPDFDESPEHKKAIQYIKNNAFDKAIQLENDILKKDPENLKAYLLLTLAYLGKGDEAKALDQVNRVKKINLEFSAEIYNNIGRFYTGKKRYYKALINFHNALKIKENANILHQVALIYQAQGRMKKAKACYEKLLDLKPDYINLARIYLAEGDYKKAIFYANNSVKKNDKDVNAYIVLGSSYLMSNDLELSKINFSKLKKLSPKFFLADYYLGLICLIQKDYDGAIQEFENALKISPKIKEARLNLSVVLHIKGNLEKAREQAQKAIDSAPGDFLGHLALGNIHISGKKYTLADQAYQKAQNLCADFALPEFKTSDYFKPDTSAYFTLSNIYFREGLFHETIKTVDEALKTDSSKNPFYLITKARAEAKLGNLKKANEIYSYITENNPEIVTAHIELGDLAVYKKDIKKAVAHYEKAAELAPRSAKIHLGIGDLCNKSGNVKKAIAEYKKVISLAPESFIGYNQLAWTLAEKRKKYKEALSYALKGNELGSENINMKDTLGWIYYQMGKYKDALKIYLDIVRSIPSNPMVYYRLGLIYQKMNKKDKAAESFERALNISDEFSEAKEAKKRLKAL
ncbi:MAG: tetratricopeptide repeat protein [Desulfobacterales bacterium]|nr:tetratricopeptide repeat protein [Desulfobacterales bacterium]